MVGATGFTSRLRCLSRVVSCHERFCPVQRMYASAFDSDPRFIAGSEDEFRTFRFLPAISRSPASLPHPPSEFRLLL